MEYVKVKYPEFRAVFIDGLEDGLANRTLRVERGTHTFNLGEPRDYRPKWRRRRVSDTTATKPMEIVFEKL